MFPLSPEKISSIVGSPLANVSLSWPKVEQSLTDLGMTGIPVCIAAIATIRIECPPFKPIKEYGSDAYLRSKKYFPFVGRGFIQITWEENYKKYGDLLGIDLIANPDLALDPDVAASIFAAYFKDHKIQDLAQSDDWLAVRRAINGGYNGLEQFVALKDRLKYECPNGL